MSQNFVPDSLHLQIMTDTANVNQQLFASLKNELLKNLSLTKNLSNVAIAPKRESDLHQLLDHGQHTVMRLYADWRVGATAAEKHAHKRDASIFLTFDDSGQPRHISKLLELLRDEKILAGFFLQGDWADTHASIVQKIRADGHLLGNHTYSHPDLLKLSDDQLRFEIEHGVESRWLRPPMGRYDNRVRKIAQDMGYAISYWSIDSDDWQGVSVDYMSQKILSELHPGAVILFHLHAANTYKLLPKLIKDIRERGFTITGKEDLVL